MNRAQMKRLAFVIETKVNKAVKDMERFNKSLNRTKRESKSLANFFKKRLGILGVSIGVEALSKKMVQLGDAYKSITDRINLYSTGNAETTRNLQALTRVSNKTRTDLQATAELYGRLSLNQKELGASTEEVIEFTEQVGKQLKISGTSMVDARGAIIQLGQGLGEGIFRAQEFNSVLENIPSLLQTVAKHIDGTGGTVSGLRRVMLAGELSSKEFFNAVLAGADDTDKKFEKISVKFQDALVVLNNFFIGFFGRIEEKTGVFGKIADGIIKVSGALENATLSVDEKNLNEVRGLKEEIAGLSEQMKNADEDTKKLIEGNIKLYQEELKAKKKTAEARLTLLKDEETLRKNISQLEKSSRDNEITLTTYEVRKDKAAENLQEARKSPIDELGIFSGEDVENLKQAESAFEEIKQERNEIKKVLDEEKKQLEKYNLQLTKRLALEQLIAEANAPTTTPPSTSSENSSGITIKGSSDKGGKQADPFTSIRKINQEFSGDEDELRAKAKELNEFIILYQKASAEFQKANRTLYQESVTTIGKIASKITTEKNQELEKAFENTFQKITKIADKALGHVKQVMDFVFQGLGVKYDNQLLALENFYQKQREILEQETEDEAFYNELRKEREEEDFQQKYGIEQERLLAMSQQEQEAFITNLNSKTQQEELANYLAVESRRKRDAEIAKLDEEKAKKEKKIKSDQWEAQKRASIAQVIIDAARAIMNIWATTPKVDFGASTIAMITASAGAGVTQAAIIGSQKNPYAYREGGIALNPQMASLAEEGKPEMVLPPGLTAMVMELNEVYKKVRQQEAGKPIQQIIQNYDNRTFAITMSNPQNAEEIARELRDEFGVEL